MFLGLTPKLYFLSIDFCQNHIILGRIRNGVAESKTTNIIAYWLWAMGRPYSNVYEASILVFAVGLFCFVWH